MQKVDIMSARQMNQHLIYITFVRVTKIEVFMYLQMIRNSPQQSILISLGAIYV